MKKLFRRLDVKLFTYFFTFSMIMVSILSYTNYKSSVNILMDNKTNQTNEEVKKASVYIATYLDKIKVLSSLISMTPNVDKLINFEENFDYSLEDTLEIILRNDALIKQISVITKDGKIVSTSEVKFEVSNDMKKVKWYKNSLKSNGMAMITTEDHTGFTMNKSDRVISVSHEIKDGNGNHAGLVIIDISYRFIEDFVSSLNLGDRGYAFILTSEERLLFDSEQMENEDLVDNQKYLNIIHDRKKAVEDNFIASEIYIPNTDWVLVGVASTEQVENLRGKLIYNTITWGILIFALSLGLAGFASIWITKPIVKLIQEMKNVERDFEPIEIDRTASIEVQELKIEYNMLLKRIQKLTKDIEEKENSKRIYELKALQSQINPHFIYNTLETILWLIEFGENKEAIEVVKSLGLILRNTLNIDQDFVKLSKELEHVKSYMDIQKVRYDDKFEYYFEIEEETEEIPVPKLILQPIVENAIYHGIKPKKSKSYIKIKSMIQDENLFIVIENDGYGFENRHSSKNKALGGIGMSNVDQRIKILCGDDFGINMIREDEITKVTYTLKI